MKNKTFPGKKASCFMFHVLSHGFTLLEILVVVSIIGILVTIGITSFSTLTKNSRDARRKTDLLQIQAALEMYKSNSSYSSYPVALPTLVAGNYLSKLPTDPKSNQDYSFMISPYPCDESTTPCTGYKLSTGLENGSGYRLSPLGEVNVCSRCSASTNQKCEIYEYSGSCGSAVSGSTATTNDCGCTTSTTGSCVFKSC